MCANTNFFSPLQVPMPFCFQSASTRSSYVRGPRRTSEEHFSLCQTLIPLITALAPPPPMSLPLRKFPSGRWPAPSLSSYASPAPPHQDISDKPATSAPIPGSLRVLHNRVVAAMETHLH